MPAELRSPQADSDALLQGVPVKTVILTSILLATLSVTALAQSVGGNYRVSGTNFNGSSYRGRPR